MLEGMLDCLATRNRVVSVVGDRSRIPFNPSSVFPGEHPAISTTSVRKCKVIGSSIKPQYAVDAHDEVLRVLVGMSFSIMPAKAQGIG